MNYIVTWTDCCSICGMRIEIAGSNLNVYKFMKLFFRFHKHCAEQDHNGQKAVAS